MKAASRSTNILFAILANAFAPVASIASAPVLAQALGVDGRGSVAAATAPLLLASAVATFGIPAAVTYSVARHPTLVRPLLSRAVLVTVAIGAVVSGVIVALRTFFAGGDEHVQGLIGLAVVALVPTLLVGLAQAAAAGLHRWRLVTLERGITASVRLAALVLLASLGALDVRSAVGVLALAPVLGGLAYVPLLRRVSSVPTQDPGASSGLLSYGLRVWLGSVSGILLTRLDQGLMTPLSNATELGLYVVAVNVADIPLVVSNAVRDVSFSAEAAENDDERMLSASRLSTAVTFVMAALLAATTWWWLPILFGADFSAALPACLWLLLATAVGGQGALAGTTLSARGAPGRRSISLAIACVVNAVLLVVLVPVLGAVGAAISTVVGSATSSSINIAQVWRAHGIAPLRFYGLRSRDVRAVLQVGARLLGR